MQIPLSARVPLFVVMMGIGALAMLVPAAVAGVQEDFETARPFLYGSILFAGLSLILGLATQNYALGNPVRGQLLSLLGGFVLLPLMLAIPLAEAVPGLSIRNGYFEMVSSLTTTGASVFDQPQNIAPAVHVWRGLVAWLGGFLVWVMAISVLAPLRLGGFEVLLTSAQVNRDATLGRSQVARHPSTRTVRHAKALAPVYAGLTLVLWVLLLTVGESPLVAFCHAMSVISTSGISPTTIGEDMHHSIRSEVVIFFFFFLAVSRCTFARDMPTPAGRKWYQDPELRFGTAIILVVPTIMFVHHFVGTLELDAVLSAHDALRAFWGGLFTSLSFLTTTGFVSADWDVAQNWSGLSTPGLILMGLALVGGGVATTAGGVKLLRIYALYKHGQTEMARLVHPSLVETPASKYRRIKPESAYIAWLFFMIFALSVTFIMLALSLANIDFETSLILTVATLSTTGPLTQVAGDAPIGLGTLSPVAQYILCGAMVLGRLETLAIVALLNPDFWRA